MKHGWKYDVAISFAEEDKFIAEKIAKALKDENISCYMYTQNIALHWGENLFKVSYNTYAAGSRFVLLLISKNYVNKKWSNIERQIVQSENRGGMANILPLRIDDTLVDGLSSDIVFVNWENDAAKIAALIKTKLGGQKKLRGKVLLSWPGITAFIILIAMSIIVLIQKPWDDAAVKGAGLSAQAAGALSGLPVTIKKIPANEEKKPEANTRQVEARTKQVDTTNREVTANRNQLNNTAVTDIDSVYDYCISVSGNNNELNTIVATVAASSVKEKNLTVSVNCRQAKKRMTIYLQEVTTKTEAVAGMLSSSCNYRVSIIDSKGAVVLSEAGRDVAPGFSLEANMNSLSVKIIEKINHLL